MKKALRLIIMYLLIYIAATFLGTLFYSFYLTLLKFIAGKKLNLFAPVTMINALFYISILMCFLVFPFLSYYRVRHVGGFFQNITYIILVVLTFALVLPGILSLRNNYFKTHPIEQTSFPLSGGYFRESNGKVYYFAKDFQSNPITNNDTTTIIIDTSENGKLSVEKIKDYPGFQLYREAVPFNEILVKDTFGNEMVNKYISFSLLADKTIESFNKGFSYYCGFILIGIAIASIYAITNLFQWKLLNTFLIILDTFIIVGTTNLYFSSYAENIKRTLSKNGFMHMLGKYVDEPVLSCFYLIFSLIVIVIGIITSLLAAKRRKNA